LEVLRASGLLPSQEHCYAAAMLTRIALLVGAAIAAPLSAQPAPTAPAQSTAQKEDLVPVAIDTSLGRIVIAIDRGRAPITAANFLSYVDRGFYDRGRFHRTVRLDNQSNAGLKIEDTDLGIADSGDAKPLPNDQIPIEVIQGGINLTRKAEQGPPIPLERTSVTGLRHLDGTISMGRTTADTAVSDFFICINDQPELDFGGQRNVDGQGFAAFGQVIEGMDTVRAIQTAPSEGQSLTPPVPITRITRA
jgi:peptidyl-prolyl cis-trans isomerase A (cyclophilin A)